MRLNCCQNLDAIEFPSAGSHMSGGIAARSQMRLNFLQQGLICLEVSSKCMKPQNAHEYVLVVGQHRHRFDIIDMSMLAKNHIQTQLYLVYTAIYYVCEDTYQVYASA